MTLDIAAIKARADAASEGPWAKNPFTAHVDAFEQGYPIPVCALLWPTDLRTEDQSIADGEFIAHARTDIPALIAALEAVQAILESDRTRIIDGVNGLSDALRRRQWLLTSRGSYEWDDARFIQEFRDAIDEIDKAVEPLRSIGADKSNCPQTTAEVIQARVDLIAALEASESARVKAEQERDALKEALKPFADEAFRYEPDDGDSDLPIWDCQLTLGNLRDARRTLEAKP